MTDLVESVKTIGGNTGQLTDSGESVETIGGNTGQLTDSGESVVRVKYLLVFQFPFLDRYSYCIFHFCVFSRYFVLKYIFWLIIN